MPILPHPPLPCTTPDNPAQFLMEQIDAMSNEEKALWTKKVTNKAIATAQGLNKGTGPSATAVAGGEAAVPLTKDTVQIVLRLELNSEDGVKGDILVRLRDTFDGFG